MRPVDRAEIVDYVTWSELRDAQRPAILAAKRARRFERGPLCFLFENRETVRYQIQEMMRVERIVREAAIQHEIATYNELLGAAGHLRCALLVGVEDELERPARLAAWRDLNRHLFARLPDGRIVRPTWDARQVGDERLSSVQYLDFDFAGVAPAALACDHPDPALAGETPLTEDERRALQADLDAP